MTDTHDDSAIDDLLSQYQSLTALGSPCTTQRDVLSMLASIIAEDDELRGVTARLMMHDKDTTNPDMAVVHSNLLYGGTHQVRDYLLEHCDELLQHLNQVQRGTKAFSEHDLEQWENEAEEFYDGTQAA